MQLIEEDRPVAVNRSTGDNTDEPADADITTKQTPDESGEQTRDDANVITSVAAGGNSADANATHDQQDHESHE